MDTTGITHYLPDTDRGTEPGLTAPTAASGASQPSVPGGTLPLVAPAGPKGTLEMMGTMTMMMDAALQATRMKEEEQREEDPPEEPLPEQRPE